MPPPTAARVGAAGLVVLAGLCTSGAFSPVPLLSDGSPAEQVGSVTAGVAVHDIEAGDPFTVGLPMLCLTRRATVVIERVAPLDPAAGLEVTAFALGPSPIGPDGGVAVGATRSSLAALVRGAGDGVDVVDATAARGLVIGGHPTVTGRCGVGQGNSQLVVEVTRATSATATTDGVVVDDTVTGEPGVRRYLSPMRITLCAPADRATEHCRVPSAPEA